MSEDPALNYNDYELNPGEEPCGEPGPREHTCSRPRGHRGSHMEFREHYTVGWQAKP